MSAVWVILALPFPVTLLWWLRERAVYSGYALEQGPGDDTPRVVPVPSDPA